MKVVGGGERLGRGKRNPWRHEMMPPEVTDFTAGGKTGPWLKGEPAELTDWLNREMTEAGLNYKQRVGIRRWIRSPVAHGIRGRRG